MYEKKRGRKCVFRVRKERTYISLTEKWELRDLKTTFNSLKSRKLWGKKKGGPNLPYKERS